MDYLADRKQMIDLDGELAETIPMNLGVPQGSILGPILFLIYVNDINKSNKDAMYTKFADDTTVLTAGNTLDEAVTKMNKALSDIDIWFKRNKLRLNTSKTRYMIFNHKTGNKSSQNRIYSSKTNILREYGTKAKKKVSN